MSESDEHRLCAQYRQRIAELEEQLAERNNEAEGYESVSAGIIAHYRQLCEATDPLTPKQVKAAIVLAETYRYWSGEGPRGDISAECAAHNAVRKAFLDYRDVMVGVDEYGTVGENYLLKERITELEEALRERGHKQDCAVVIWSNDKAWSISGYTEDYPPEPNCTCGLDDMLTGPDFEQFGFGRIDPCRSTGQ